MIEFKAFNEVCRPDPMHSLLDEIAGTQLTLEGLHDALSRIKLNNDLPLEIQEQFNVARNLALYTWFSYYLDPVAQLKFHAFRVGPGQPM